MKIFSTTRYRWVLPVCIVCREYPVYTMAQSRDCMDLEIQTLQYEKRCGELLLVFLKIHFSIWHCRKLLPSEMINLHSGMGDFISDLCPETVIILESPILYLAFLHGQGS